ncbi:unnamed protein product, partial [Protopolystoma xenopodis]
MTTNCSVSPEAASITSSADVDYIDLARMNSTTTTVVANSLANSICSSDSSLRNRPPLQQQRAQLAIAATSAFHSPRTSSASPSLPLSQETCAFAELESCTQHCQIKSVSRPISVDLVGDPDLAL